MEHVGFHITYLLSYTQITFVDFIMYEILDQHKVLAPECLKDLENLEQFLERIQNLEKIEAFIKSPRFIKYPVNNRAASFGG
jgi:glutathione S-transferase